jgi:hypothetical protein
MQRPTVRVEALADRRPSPSWASSLSADARDGVPFSCSGRPEAIVCGRSSGRSRRNCEGACTNRFLPKDIGSSRWFEGTSRITRCQRTIGRSVRSDTTSRTSGVACLGGVARRMVRRGNGSTRSPMPGSRNLESFTRGPTSVLPSNTQGKSPVPELGTPGSVRGVPSNGHPYRDRTA